MLNGVVSVNRLKASDSTCDSEVVNVGNAMVTTVVLCIVCVTHGP